MLRPLRAKRLFVFALLALPWPLAAQTTTRLTTGSVDWQDPSVDLAGKMLVYSRGNVLYLHNVRKGWTTVIGCNVDEGQVAPGGKFVVYSSDADVLGTNDEGNKEIFLFDIRRQRTIQVTSAGSSLDSEEPSISKNGRWIAFLSEADFAGSNSDASQEVFLHDRTEGTYVQITSASSGSPSDNVHIAPNGSSVVFDSTADLTGGNSDGNREIFRYDVEAAAVEQLTSTTGGNSQRPFPSKSGRYVVFESTSDELSGANSDGTAEVYRLDTNDSSVLRLTDTSVASSRPMISGNGKNVTYESDGDPLGSNSDGSTELFLVEIAGDDTLSRTQVTSGATGTDSQRAACSSSATRVFFQSDADLTGAGSGTDHVFMYLRS
ncbi:MAG: PD40 domain-containing protein [Planctomycetes bacterium]|nr:PD40 domain-containing protein [Planctomycetota bacterium]